MSKDNDIFDLAAMPPSTAWITTPGVFTASKGNLPITMAEKRSAVEGRKDLQVIEQERRKALAGHQAAGDIYYSQYATMASLVDRTWEICQQKRDPVPQAIVSKYWERTVIRAGGHIEVISETAIRGIAGVIADTSEVDRLPNSVGLIAKITGRDNGL